MKGLLTKDFLTIRKKYGFLRLILDLTLILALMIVLKHSASLYISLLLIPLEVASMLISLSNTDEVWKWSKYAVALPLSKNKIVGSRYVFGALASGIGLCVALAVNTVSCFCFPFYSFRFSLLLSLAAFCLALLFLALILPSNYWLGVNAGLATMFLLILLVLGSGFWSRAKNASILEFLPQHLDAALVLSFCGTVVLYALSYLLSVPLFKRAYR